MTFRTGWMKLLLLGLLLWASLPAPAKTAKPPLRDTGEWIELSRIWRQMSEHWSGRICSHQKFIALMEKNREAVLSLPTLEAKAYLDTKTRTALEEYFLRRGRFIEGQLYVPSTNLNLANLDSYAFSAQTRMENLLASLLWPPPLPEKEQKKFLEQTRKDLIRQIAFMQRAGELARQIAQRRQEAEKEAAQGVAVDWGQFEWQALARTRGLINDYNAGKIKPSKETLRLRDLIVSLTEEPLPPLPEAASRTPSPVPSPIPSPPGSPPAGK